MFNKNIFINCENRDKQFYHQVLSCISVGGLWLPTWSINNLFHSHVVFVLTVVIVKRAFRGWYPLLHPWEDAVFPSCSLSLSRSIKIGFFFLCFFFISLMATYRVAPIPPPVFHPQWRFYTLPLLHPSSGLRPSAGGSAKHQEREHFLHIVGVPLLWGLKKGSNIHCVNMLSNWFTIVCI